MGGGSTSDDVVSCRLRSEFGKQSNIENEKPTGVSTSVPSITRHAGLVLQRVHRMQLTICQHRLEHCRGSDYSGDTNSCIIPSRATLERRAVYLPSNSHSRGSDIHFQQRTWRRPYRYFQYQNTQSASMSLCFKIWAPLTNGRRRWQRCWGLRDWRARGG